MTPQPHHNQSISSMNSNCNSTHDQIYQTVNTGGGMNMASKSTSDVFNVVNQSPSIEIRDDSIGSPASIHEIYSTAPMTGNVDKSAYILFMK